ncbi:NAD(P)H-hydrate epimerase [Rhodopirellula sp. JC740]|uniref:NAD(P)H-hydrate epimerase n=1 Tax=Rhodopirellula halodulae TaxID=2894198 RepID=A0ABS8NJJ8_9BACT|nr:NAD(P)H-hydrate epimerase [Rhodopirellula sp. JC740]MCC9643735.1 NAD(P)H-hydrate epimerase [Rhodopirellula sp. JC740]
MQPVRSLPPMTCDQVREIDQVAMNRYQMPSIVLMENAGRGAAEAIQAIVPDGRVVILCGKGNNGGDGFAIARHLQLAGRGVRIFAIANLDELKGDAATQARIAQASGIEIDVPEGTIDSALNSAEVIVDGLLGTGAKPPLRGRYAEWVESANRADATRIALDIPTGLDGDTGEAGEPTFCAHHTLTFAASKVGFAKANAGIHTGDVQVISIGVPLKLLREFAG